MNTIIPDLVRALITDIMLVALIYCLSTPKYKTKSIYFGMTAVLVILNLSINTWFYLHQDYNSVVVVDLFMIFLIAVAIKPLFADTKAQWCFSWVTVLNIYAIVVFLSYILCQLFSNPYVANAVFRFLFFSPLVLIFWRLAGPIYHKVKEYWHVFSLITIPLLVNFLYYFLTGDVEETLRRNMRPIFLLVFLTIFVYLGIFLFFKIVLEHYDLREENIKAKSQQDMMELSIDTMKQRMALMDETVRQMSVFRHDQRHMNATLLELLQNDNLTQAIVLIQQQIAVLPSKPTSFCENVTVNAAVSYYVEMAEQKGINCIMRLDIPENLSCSELGLSMTVSNLLENAINACQTLAPGRERYLRMSAVYTGQLILEVENPYSGQILLTEDGYPAAREKSHGRGSESVRIFVKEVGGDIFYCMNHGVFKVRVLL